MRLPNGFGSVYKLSGKRRKPWCARKTVGWSIDEESGKAFPEYQFIGYYATRQEALTALTDFNKDPSGLHEDTITFRELYDKWSDVHYEKISDANIKTYKAAFNSCKPLWDMKVQDIKLAHLQKAVDDSGKNTPTLKKIKNMLGMMYDFAVIHEIANPQKREIVRHIDITKAGNPNAFSRKPFSKKAIKSIRDAQPTNEYLSVVLMLIYTGVRIGELLDLKKEDIHLSERWFFVKESKTDAGIREVPIAEKVVPFFEHWMKKDCEYLVCTGEGKHLTYSNYYRAYWIPLMEDLHLSEHTPHCARYTCISLLTEAGVDERIIQQIVGHKGQNVTQAVYTHLDLPAKLEAMNRI